MTDLLFSLGIALSVAGGGILIVVVWEGVYALTKNIDFRFLPRPLRDDMPSLLGLIAAVATFAGLVTFAARTLGA